jgi:hypothetical protein
MIYHIPGFSILNASFSNGSIMFQGTMPDVTSVSPIS